MKLIEKVRALESGRTNTLPAVAITAYTREEDRDRVLSSGYQSFLPKQSIPRNWSLSSPS